MHSLHMLSFSQNWSLEKKEEWRKEAAHIPPPEAKNDLYSTRQSLALYLMLVYLRDGSVQTIFLAATLR